MKKEVKTARRGRHSVQKMKDRREIKKCRQFLLKEIEKEGEKHYYVVKKEVEEPSNMTAVEDIFADWNSNFARIKRPRTFKHRTRKISHHAERKEIIKEAKKAEEVMQGPLTYSQMVRKNLKIPKEQPSVEEIYETWIKCIDKMYKTPKNTNGADDIEVFKCWNFIFGYDEVKPAVICPPPISAFECGQPTIPKINLKVQRNAESAKISKKEMKSASTKASKKQSIEKLSEKLLHEGYPLNNSDEVKQVLDMVQKKKENVSIAETEKDPKEAKSPTMIKKSEKEVVLRNKMQFVPFVEKKSVKESMEELLKKMKTEMPKDVVQVAKDFKPSTHSQRRLAPEVIVQPFIGPINKPYLPKEVIAQTFIGPINISDLSRSKIIATKDSPMPKQTWISLIKEKVESGRGEVKKYQTEEIFDQWRHIFVLTNQQVLKPKLKEAALKQDIYFMEWLRNFDEPNVLTEKRERSSKSDSEEKSPKPSKKAAKKQLRIQDIEDDVTEMKDTRRQDFMKATTIRDKKRTEASCNSLGKRVK